MGYNNEYNKFFYLYNPIPIVKNEAAYVINRILKSKKISYTWGDDIDLNTLDAVNRMRFKNYITRILENTEVRGHAIEGMMVGLYGGTLNSQKSGLWDYETNRGKVEQKYSQNFSENPSIGSFTSALNRLGEENLKIIKNILSKYGDDRMNIFYVNDEGLTEYKVKILEEIISDFVAVTSADDEKITTYYLTKEQCINYFVDAKNISAARKKNTNELRVKGSLFINNGESFEIKFPQVTDEEYEKYLKVNSGELEVSRIFGPYHNKIRPDILNWINTNKDEFKNLVNSYLK